MTTASIKRLCKKTHGKRAVAASAHYISDKAMRNGYYLHAALQELAVLEAFKKADWDTDEEVVAAMAPPTSLRLSSQRRVHPMPTSSVSRGSYLVT